MLIVDMLVHDREQYRQEMGHVWLGFAEKRILGFLSQAGLASTRFHPLPPDPEAKGPNLFVATARRPATVI